MSSSTSRPRDYLTGDEGTSSRIPVSAITSYTGYSFQQREVDSIGSCQLLFKTLISTDVRGPQLFRLKQEFEILPASKGRSGQSDVLKAKDEIVAQIKEARKHAHGLDWSIDSIVIKRHRPKGHRASSQGSSSSKLGRHFLAAHREILAFSSNTKIRGHPNIVQLRGWGFCLDTFEDPQQDGALQVPLLVLERADHDLKDFLQGPSSISSELAINLCKDVGDGLQVLHENNFTHGDLKPHNILVFRRNNSWIAKLCDFGCARWASDKFTSQTADSDQASHMSTVSEARYDGTPNWRPPEVMKGTVKTFDHEALRLCDIYVYGLIVWSVVCKSDKTKGMDCYPQDEYTNCEKALKKALSELEKRSLKPQSTHNMVKDVLENCLCEPIERARDSRPWTAFDRASLTKSAMLSGRSNSPRLPHVNFSSAVRVLRSSTAKCRDGLMGSGVRTPPLTSTSAFVCSSLHPAQKADYENLDCWDRQRPSIELHQGVRPRLYMDPASEDRDCHSLAKFHEPITDQNLQAVHQGIRSSLGDASVAARRMLYTRARFRSRVSFEQWNGLFPQENLLALSLSTAPIPDINTLAWLCRGEVGIQEVRGLSPDPKIWKTVLDGSFNESDRLGRFLLLLQCGARVEQKMPCSTKWDDPEPRTVLFEYIRSCRRAIVGAVMREICTQFKGSHMVESTKLYLTGRGQYGTASAFKDFVSAIDYDAARELHKAGHSRKIYDLTYLKEVSRGRGVFKLEYRRNAEQILGLINGQTSPSIGRGKGNVQAPIADTDDTLPLPRGWDDVSVTIPRSLRKPGKQIPLYKDVTTRSITTIRPAKPFLAGAQIRVGWQDDKEQGDFLDVDIDIFFGPKWSVQSKEAFVKRFPMYTDVWYRSEQYVMMPTEDILASLTDPWTLPSFGDNLDMTWLAHFGSLCRRILSTSWLTLAVYGLRILPLMVVLIRPKQPYRAESGSGSEPRP